MTNINNIQWKRTAAEGVAVVVSILLAFWIDTLWDGRQEAQLETVYLLELQEDFERNKSLLEDQAAELGETARSMLVLQEQSTLETPSMSVSELNENFGQILNMSSLFLVNRAYANMTGSGDLRIIRSRPLKNALAEYYAAARVITLVQNTHEMELVQIYEPYIIENLDYAAVAVVRIDDFPLTPPVEVTSILEVLATRKFRNILIQKSVITTDLINEFRKQLELTDNVLRLLKLAHSEITSEGSS
ncbi:MAG: hypothetical protein ACI88G_001120 [Woeseiaceae bacterium]|jgi:hypothetical protein